MKKKICLVCDLKGWAFDAISNQLKKELSYKYDFTIKYYDLKADGDSFFEFLEENDNCDLIHFFWRKSLLQMETEIFRRKVEENGNNFEQYIEQKKEKISTGVYDFLYLTNSDIDTYKNVFNKYVKRYYVSSKKLFDQYEKIKQYNKPEMTVHDIFNREIFHPQNLERFEAKNINNRELVIGWVGNSIRKENGVDLKGLNTIIKPVISELKSEGFNITENYADRNEKWRTTSQMPEYYSEIDLCLCTSIHEGTPLPVLEAMSCGVPLISTDVGIVREAFGKKQGKYILGSREYGKNDDIIRDVLKQKIIELYNNRQELKELSMENQQSIDEYCKQTKQEYEMYFDLFLNNVIKNQVF